MFKKVVAVGAMVLATSGLVAAAPPDIGAVFSAMMKASFRDQGIAKVDRLTQDASNEACSHSEGKPLPDELGRRIESANLASIKAPSDGQYIGNWKEGEKLAQNGRGMTWTDPSSAPAANGGNCYNCHQITKAEISYGTIGPSLYNYGKLRGVKDPTAPVSKPIVEYTWAKLYNAKAYNACSLMPRFGTHGLLNEKQLKDIMALLLDPQSAANE